jgi:hypothetical protein
MASLIHQIYTLLWLVHLNGKGMKVLRFLSQGLQLMKFRWPAPQLIPPTEHLVDCP